MFLNFGGKPQFLKYANESLAFVSQAWSHRGGTCNPWNLTGHTS